MPMTNMPPMPTQVGPGAPQADSVRFPCFVVLYLVHRYVVLVPGSFIYDFMEHLQLDAAPSPRRDGRWTDPLLDRPDIGPCWGQPRPPPGTFRQLPKPVGQRAAGLGQPLGLCGRYYSCYIWFSENTTTHITADGRLRQRCCRFETGWLQPQLVKLNASWLLHIGRRPCWTCWWAAFPHCRTTDTLGSGPHGPQPQLQQTPYLPRFSRLHTALPTPLQLVGQAYPLDLGRSHLSRLRAFGDAVDGRHLPLYLPTGLLSPTPPHHRTLQTCGRTLPIG